MPPHPGAPHFQPTTPTPHCPIVPLTPNLQPLYLLLQFLDILPLSYPLGHAYMEPGRVAAWGDPAIE